MRTRQAAFSFREERLDARVHSSGKRASGEPRPVAGGCCGVSIKSSVVRSESQLKLLSGIARTAGVAVKQLHRRTDFRGLPSARCRLSEVSHETENP
jgi:hypothetical protein